MAPTRITVLEGLFPEQVRCVIAAEFPAQFRLLPAERDSAERMSARRRIEFVQGRSCARVALAGLGYPDCPVPQGPDRAPVWPDRVVGSISHCAGKAAAAVAHREDVGGLGLDLELIEELDQPLVPMICREDEQAGLGSGDIRLLTAKLVFSAKESVFKCVYPRIRRFIDFLEVGIRLDLDANTFSARPHSRDLDADLFGRVRGRFGQSGNLFVTACYLA